MRLIDPKANMLVVCATDGGVGGARRGGAGRVDVAGWVRWAEGPWSAGGEANLL